MTQHITNDIEAFTMALRLAVSAPTNKLSKKALNIAQSLSKHLTLKQINGVKEMLEKEVV